MHSKLLPSTVILLAAAIIVPSMVVRAGASVPLTLQLRDALTQQPTAARVYIRDSSGWLFETPDSVLYTRGDPWTGPYRHIEGEVIVEVELGLVEIMAVRGLTGIPVVRSENVTGATTLQIDLDRWIDPSGHGWIGADPHVHSWHDGEYPPPQLDHVGLTGRAEDLDVIFLLDNDPAQPSGRALPAQPNVEIEYGAEYRNGFWGHMIFLELTEFVLPSGGYGCCGGASHAWPTLGWRLSNSPVSLAILAHPKPTDDPTTFSHTWPGSGVARELYSLALSPLVHGISVASATNNPDVFAVELYLDALRAGARWAAVGEGDRTLDRRVGLPLGCVRTFAQPETGVPTDPAALAGAWRQAVLERRSFATSGPFLHHFAVDGVEIGQELQLAGPSTVEVDFELSSLVPMQRLTLHGATGVHWEQILPAGTTVFASAVPVALEHDDFVLLEVEGAQGTWFSNPRETRLVATPVWVEMGLPWPHLPDVARREVDTLWSFWHQALQQRGFATVMDSLAVLETIETAAAVYEAQVDDPPPPFDLIWPEEGKVFPAPSAYLAWEASPSLDGEPTTYTVELDDLDDAQGPFTAPPVPTETTTVDGLTPGHSYRWTVYAHEPGDPATPSTESRTFQISDQIVATDSFTELRLSTPWLAGGLVRARLTVPQATSIRARWVDVRGRSVESRRLELPSGTHTLEWNGTDSTGQSVANGVYWLVVESSLGARSRRIVLIR